MADFCRFEIKAISDAQTLPRLVEHFAQRGLTPSFVQAEVSGDGAFVVIEHASLDLVRASIIAERMRASVLIEYVVLRAQHAALGKTEQGRE